MTGTSPLGKPEPDAYFMGIALAVRSRANCTGRRVGALIVRDYRILSTGYNGTPTKMRNCEEGGCHRCANPDAYPSGEGYDLCICVHAEQNTLLSAARFGNSIEGATIYSTMQPCFGCGKELIQAQIRRVVYLHPWSPSDADEQMDMQKKAEYEKLPTRDGATVRSSIRSCNWS